MPGTQYCQDLVLATDDLLFQGFWDPMMEVKRNQMHWDFGVLFIEEWKYNNQLKFWGE